MVELAHERARLRTTDVCSLLDRHEPCHHPAHPGGSELGKVRRVVHEHLYQLFVARQHLAHLVRCAHRARRRRAHGCTSIGVPHVARIIWLTKSSTAASRHAAAPRTTTGCAAAIPATSPTIPIAYSARSMCATRDEYSCTTVGTR